MTPTLGVLLILAFVAVLLAAALVARVLLGPDRDLEGWDPAAPTPGTRRRPCLDASCRVDHARLGAWRERAPR